MAHWVACMPILLPHWLWHKKSDSRDRTTKMRAWSNRRGFLFCMHILLLMSFTFSKVRTWSAVISRSRAQPNKHNCRAKEMSGSDGSSEAHPDWSLCIMWLSPWHHIHLKKKERRRSKVCIKRWFLWSLWCALFSVTWMFSRDMLVQENEALCLCKAECDVASNIRCMWMEEMELTALSTAVRGQSHCSLLWQSLL